jgi:crotonobetainyl-CoA:carnitine CoA-transferase CaiB-like acyl-CoA transferase
VCNDPHIIEAREMILEMDHPLGGKMKVISCPIKFTNQKASIRSTAPLLGEHTRQVLAEILEMSNEEYTKLKQTGAVG